MPTCDRPTHARFAVESFFNTYTAMGDYSRPKLNKRSLLWATIVAEKFFLKKIVLNSFFHFCFVVPFYLRFKYS